MHVTNAIPLGCLLLLPVSTVHSVETRKVPAKCDVQVRSFCENVDTALASKLTVAKSATAEVLELLTATKEELISTTREIDTLERAIDAQRYCARFGVMCRHQCGDRVHG
jgi:hypothetical protein